MKEAGILVGVDREELLSWGMLGWGSLPYLGQQDIAVRIVCNHKVPGSQKLLLRASEPLFK